MGSSGNGHKAWSDSDSEEDKAQVYDAASAGGETYGMVFTFAAKLGQAKPELVDTTFADCLADHYKMFLRENQGSFNLKSLLKLPSSLAKTDFHGVS